MVNSVIYHSWSSRLTLVMHPYFFKLLRVLSLSRRLVEFSLASICYHIWEKIFNLWCSHQKMHWIYWYLVTPQFPSQHLRCNVLKICFPQGPRTNWSWKIWFSLLNFNQKIWRWLGTIVYLYFVWFVIFLNVMALLFCE